VAESQEARQVSCCDALFTLPSVAGQRCRCSPRQPPRATGMWPVCNLTCLHRHTPPRTAQQPCAARGRAAFERTKLAPPVPEGLLRTRCQARPHRHTECGVPKQRFCSASGQVRVLSQVFAVRSAAPSLLPFCCEVHCYQAPSTLRSSVSKVGKHPLQHVAAGGAQATCATTPFRAC